MKTLIEIWRENGTKILGGIIALLGVFVTLDPQTLTAIFGEKGPSVAVTLGGILTFLRGFTNSKKA